MEASKWGGRTGYLPTKGMNWRHRCEPLRRRKRTGSRHTATLFTLVCRLFAASYCCNAISLFALLAICCRCLLSAAVQVAPLEVAIGAQIAVCAYGSARYGEDGCIARVFFFQGVAQVIAMRKAAKPYEILPSPAFPHQFQPTFF